MIKKLIECLIKKKNGYEENVEYHFEDDYCCCWGNCRSDWRAGSKFVIDYFINGLIVNEKQAGFFPPVCVLFRKIENLINLVG